MHHSLRVGAALSRWCAAGCSICTRALSTRARLIPSFLALLLFGCCDVRLLAHSDRPASSSRSSGTCSVPGWMLEATQGFGAWWSRPKQPLTVHQYLPAARPRQPWPYRQLHSAQQAEVTVTDSYAMQAAVSHAPLKGITSDMLYWWWHNVDGAAPYTGDGQVWDKYLQWHPRDHIHHKHVTQSADSSTAPAAPLWEICEYFMCPVADGYTAGSSPPPEPQQGAEGPWAIKAITQLQHISSNNISMTVPTRWGVNVAVSLWQLQHTWHDSPEGLLVNSSQVVGVVEPGWRPLWYARWRNALVRGLFSHGRDPGWMLQQWLRHCVEEIGNLEHILPSLYAAAAAEDSGRPSNTRAQQDPVSSPRPFIDRGVDEL